MGVGGLGVLLTCSFEYTNGQMALCFSEEGWQNFPP